MFKLWKEDTPETINTVYNSDFSCTMITDLLADRDENKKVQTMLVELTPTLMDIFRHIQSQSESYPLIRAKDVMEFMMDKLENLM